MPDRRSVRATLGGFPPPAGGGIVPTRGVKVANDAENPGVSWLGIPGALVGRNRRRVVPVVLEPPLSQERRHVETDRDGTDERAGPRAGRVLRGSTSTTRGRSAAAEGQG